MKLYLRILTTGLMSISLIGCSSDADDALTDNGPRSESISSKEDNGESQDNISMNSNTGENLTADDSNSGEVLTYDEATGEKVPAEIILDGTEVETIAEQVGEPTKETKKVSKDDDQPTYDFHAYKNLDALLKKYVSAAGKVNYSGIKGNKASLDVIIKEFKDNYPASDWSKNQKLSYWINAYNIFTIKLIVDNYPTTSITSITAKPWDKQFVKLGSHTYSLNNVENDIIRKKFNEPRIHFALNCASESCPVLLNSAYTASNLNYKLTSQTKRFLNDSSKNKFDNTKKIYISKIFDWYGADFNKNGATVVDFINKYRTEQLDSPKILYTEYSWDLNN